MPRGLLQTCVNTIIPATMALAMVALNAASADTDAAATPRPANSPAATAGKPGAAQATPAASSEQKMVPVVNGLAEAGSFEESTMVHGKIGANLKGVWLLVTAAWRTTTPSISQATLTSLRWPRRTTLYGVKTATRTRVRIGKKRVRVPGLVTLGTRG